MTHECSVFSIRCSEVNLAASRRASARFKQKKRVSFLIGMILSMCALAPAQSLVCKGILGNSGAYGEQLVRFNPRGGSGIGVIHDRLGTFWDRGGEGTLNRYALDGRLIAHYSIPAGVNRNADQIALAEDTVVVLVNGKLHSLAIDAPPGSTAEPLDIAATALSPSAHDGKVAIVSGDKVMLLEVATGQLTPVTDGGAQWLELATDGAVYAMRNWQLHKFVDGKPINDDWPRGGPGERPQLLGEYWYGHGWHGTIKRFTESMQPEPGVVLGGASGSFIGHLDENAELVNGRGMAQITERLFAVSGIDGILHLLEWDQKVKQMTIIRRIGSIPTCSGLAIDMDGNIFYRAGSWKWSDQPDTPLRFGVNGPEAPGVGQPVMVDGRYMAAPAYLWGQPAFYSGRLDRHVQARRIGDASTLRKGFAGSATYLVNGKRLLLVVDDKGKGQAFRIGHDGSYAGDEGDVNLEPATPLEAWTSLGTVADDVLVAAADGHVVSFARENGNWRETSRWSDWGENPDEHFGESIHLHVDDGRLWIADTDRHRVLVFPATGGGPIAVFGQTDQPGTDLSSLSAPATIAANGRRAVVHDRQNQRLVKLALELE